jgi:RimJ/RimL family protein N-acetyltransferase
MTARPPKELAAGPVTLVAFRGDEAANLYRAVAENIDHLRPWMPWAAGEPTVPAQADYIAQARREWDAGTAFGYWLREDTSGELVGCAGLHHRVGPGAIEIGYWVSASRVRRGYATESARALTTAAFAMPRMERVEIHCDEANVASAGVPRRLGYRLDRVIEDAPIEAPGERGPEMIWTMAAADWVTAPS